MKFFIRRVSDWESENQPYEGAFKDTYIRVDTRVVDCPTKIPMYKNDPEAAKQDWYSEGENHRVENGYIKRDMEENDAWFIEINSLEELLKIKEGTGHSLVIKDHYETDEYLEIEIYDDYRE